MQCGKLLFLARRGGDENKLHRRKSRSTLRRPLNIERWRTCENEDLRVYFYALVAEITTFEWQSR